MYVPRAGGLADVGVRLEGRQRGFGVAGRERALIFADEVGLVDVGVWLRSGGRMAWLPVSGHVLK
jgi:hypothetical protein